MPANAVLYHSAIDGALIYRVGQCSTKPQNCSPPNMMDHKKQLPAAAAEDSPAAEADEACTPSNDCSSRISTFLRVKPVARPTGRILLEPLDGSVEFRVPRDQAAGWVCLRES